MILVAIFLPRCFAADTVYPGSDVPVFDRSIGVAAAAAHANVGGIESSPRLARQQVTLGTGHVPVQGFRCTDQFLSVARHDGRLSDKKGQRDIIGAIIGAIVVLLVVYVVRKDERQLVFHAAGREDVFHQLGRGRLVLVVAVIAIVEQGCRDDQQLCPRTSQMANLFRYQEIAPAHGTDFHFSSWFRCRVGFLGLQREAFLEGRSYRLRRELQGYRHGFYQGVALLERGRPRC
mmetsp:Transcript_1917/g.4583  ORF Transcript_1917/g.4583 Transcript_1917/m.4583 type:complete len:233 (+) Transcript_1917:150-848(+)